MSFVFLNGRILPADEARISAFDRGFLYGDGLFETIRVQGGRLFRWPQHFTRLQSGLQLLGIRLPDNGPALACHAGELILANQCVDGVLRMTVSRGVGVRGYSAKGAGSPTVMMSLHPRTLTPETSGLRLITAAIRVPVADPLTAIKSANKLHHVLARAEAEAAGADDALLLNVRGELVSLTSGNLFWMDRDTLCTPALEAGVLPGIARAVVMEIAAKLGMRIVEPLAGPDVLSGAEVFGTNVVSGPVSVVALDDRRFPTADKVTEIRRRFDERVEEECGEIVIEN